MAVIRNQSWIEMARADPRPAEAQNTMSHWNHELPQRQPTMTRCRPGALSTTVASPATILIHVMETMGTSAFQLQALGAVCRRCYVWSVEMHNGYLQDITLEGTCNGQDYV